MKVASVLKMPMTLPSEYQQVGTIKGNSAGLYFDTGIKLTSEYGRLTMEKVQIHSGTTVYFFGSGSAGGNNIFHGYLYNNGFGTRFGSGTFLNQHSWGLNQAKDIDVLANSGSFSVSMGGTAKTGTYAGTCKTNGNFYIGFTQGMTAGSSSAGIVSFGKVRIYDTATHLACELIPCKRKSDNIVGMFNTITRTFLSGNGNWSVLNATYTEDIKDVSMFNISSKNTIEIMDKNNDVIFEDWYTEKSVLTSSGTQYINTGLIPTVNTKVVMNASIVNYGSSSWNGILGCNEGGTGNGKHNFLMCKGSGSAGYVSIATGTHWVNDLSAGGFCPMTAGTFYDVTIDNTSIKVGSVTKSYSATTGTTQTLPMYLFKTNSGNSLVNVAMPSVSVKTFKVYNGSTLIMDLIPVILKGTIPASRCANSSLAHTAGTTGMWDKVNNKFYGNAGTGVFTAS